MTSKFKSFIDKPEELRKLGGDFFDCYLVKKILFENRKTCILEIKEKKSDMTTFVVKVLKNNGKNHVLKKRFKEEINSMRFLVSKRCTVIPIEDYSLNSEYPWYIMKKATKFESYLQQFDFYSRIEIVEELAEKLIEIHSYKYAHRDLKLENILIIGNKKYAQKIVYSDFGLVFHPEKQKFTRTNESVGNWKTIAPEMMHDAYNFKDPWLSDVFSFTKVAWMILTMDFNSFWGPYLKDGMHALSKYNLETNTIVPLDNLFISATKENPYSRPDMETFLKEFLKWKKINSDKPKAKIINQKERHNEFIINTPAKLRTNVDEIEYIHQYLFMQLVESKFNILSNMFNNMLLKSVALSDQKNFLILKIQLVNKSIDIHCKPKSLEILSNHDFFKGGTYYLNIDNVNRESFQNKMIGKEVVFIEEINLDEIENRTNRIFVLAVEDCIKIE